MNTSFNRKRAGDLSVLSAVVLCAAVAVCFTLAAPIAAQSSQAQATISWTDVTDETSYRVERSDDGGTTYAAQGTVATDITSFNDNNAGAGLALSTLYCWRIVSVNDFGEAAPSSPACGQADIPGQVIGVQVLLGPHP